MMRSWEPDYGDFAIIDCCWCCWPYQTMGPSPKDGKAMTVMIGGQRIPTNDIFPALCASHLHTFSPSILQFYTISTLVQGMDQSHSSLRET